MIQFNFPTILLFGENSVNQLASKIKEDDVKKILLVTDPGLIEIGLAEKVIEKLSKIKTEIIKTSEKKESSKSKKDVDKPKAKQTDNISKEKKIEKK